MSSRILTAAFVLAVGIALMLGHSRSEPTSAAGPLYLPFAAGQGALNEGRGYHCCWGWDFSMSAGTAVRAAASGTIETATNNNDCGGNFVNINHGGGIVTQYLHLSGFGPGISGGVGVSAGQVIGYAGATGCATGAHLHFAVLKNGSAVDPGNANNCNISSSSTLWTACPAVPYNPDSDGDGILDATDQCDDDPEDFDGFEDQDGCPEAPERPSPIPSALASCDFNGDGIDDLAFGFASESVDGQQSAGAVHVAYGERYLGVVTTSAQRWHQGSAGISGNVEAFDSFGAALACGHFDSDSVHDLAVGSPGEDVHGAMNTGAIWILYGVTGSGLSGVGSQQLDQNDVSVNQAEDDDRFGDSLAAGDFDADGIDDLAIGIPREDVGSPVQVDAGQIMVMYGSPSGITATNSRGWSQNSVDGTDIEGTAEAGDFLGRALATGDFDGDGTDDVAIGAPGEEVSGHLEAGAVNVIYGAAGAGLMAAGNKLWHQDVAEVNGEAEAGDNFGAALASGRFDSDEFDDLSIGIPFEHIGAIEHAGAVAVFRGSGDGLTVASPNFNDQFWSQDATDIEGVAEAGDLYGGALAAADFDISGDDDLAIGVPRENIQSIANAGAIAILRSATGGLTGNNDQLWHQDSPGVPGNSAIGDFMGGSVATGDFNDDTIADLAAAVPGEGAGAVVILFGSSAGLSSVSSMRWSLPSPICTDIDKDNICDPSDFEVLDNDFDGCPDLRESGMDTNLGGNRNRFDPWDFYDVNGTGDIDLADTLVILNAFGALPGDGTYSALLDRFAPDPLEPWRTAAANDGIDLSEALLNLQSFGHSCV